MDKKQISTNVTWHSGKVSLNRREKMLGQKGCVIWLTGLSGSGKSTIASALEEKLMLRGNISFILDGDNVRHGLNGDLGFSSEDRAENVRRIGQVAGLFCQAGLITVVSFISPYIAGRQAARNAVPEGRFIEVYLDVPIDECEKRDPKGLYKKARQGQIADFTGIDSPYEAPENPELVLKTHQLRPEECADEIIDQLVQREIISSK